MEREGRDRLPGGVERAASPEEAPETPRYHRRVSPEPFNERAFDRLVDLIDGTPVMSPRQGRQVWRHFARSRPSAVLDIGTCFGTSAAYFAGALRSLGIDGRVVTVDTAQFDHLSDAGDWCEALWDRCGVRDLIEVHRIEHSSYAWWLLEEAERCRGTRGRVLPAYDFVYLDGAKLFTLDASSVVLIERLLRPRGWLLVDDLDWSYLDHSPGHPEPVLRFDDDVAYRFSDAERSRPQLRAVWEVIVATDPAFDRLLVTDGRWGWARKRRRPPRRPLGQMIQPVRRRLVEAVTGTMAERPLRAAAERLRRTVDRR